MLDQQSNIEIPIWAYAYGGPVGSAKIKVVPDDFIVEEQLPFEPEGSGEHVFLQIQKCSENTEFVARLLARFAGVRQRDVSYAGLKDRQAKTTQWFSVWLPGKADPDWKQLETDNIKVLNAVRHARKLKRGVIAGNCFSLIVKDLQCDTDKLEHKLQKIKQLGMPNYFGLQRFGRQGQNINKAITLFNGARIKREQKSIYLSAVRSYLFNQLLSHRVQLANWNLAEQGDIFVFERSNSYFKTELVDESVRLRIQQNEIHPTGMMFGSGGIQSSGAVKAMEQSVIQQYHQLSDGLLTFDLKADRRSLRVLLKDFNWQFSDDSQLQLRFTLPAGSYATALIRELFEVTN